MKIVNLLTACAIATPLLFVSCSEDAVTASDVDAGGMKVTLTLGVSAGPADVSSRADADGQYYDKGLDGEREVNDAMIVIYDHPINYTGDDGKVVKVFYITNPGPFEASTDVKSAYYFDPVPSYYPQTDVLNYVTVGKTNLSDACRQSFEIKDDAPLEVGKRYYATALCNFGQDMVSTFEGMTLKEFRDYIYTGALYDTANKIKEYTNFRMTGINEASFIWERKTTGSLDLGDYLVQRLAARVDVAFGTRGVDYLNYDTYVDDGYIQLAVYTQKENSNDYEIVKEGDTETPKYNFYLTDIKIVKAVNNGMYLIERSSPHSPSYRDDKNQPAVPVYLDNEGWSNFASTSRKATKYIYCRPSKSYTDLYSLAQKAGYTNMCALVSDGSFYGTSDYDKKNNSSLVGYLTENTCSENNYTMVRIEGYTNASTSAIFTGSRAYDPSADSNLKKVVGDIPIMHNTDADSHVMDYAVVRNTIYRLRIKVIANDNKIYFRYYYIEPGSKTQKEYGVACFYETVSDNTQDNPTIND